jgi:hypothetical protein
MRYHVRTFKDSKYKSLSSISYAHQHSTANSCVFSKKIRDKTMPNPRGAPKGNLNALKHGFYSRLFHTSEASDLTESQSNNLEHEIKLLRVMIRRTMEMADGIDDLREATRVLGALGAAAGRLAALLQAQRSLTEGHTQLADEISIAIQQVNAELRKKNV